MTVPTPEPPENTPPNTAPTGQWHAFGQGSAAVSDNRGITSTGPDARNTQIHLPSEAFTPPEQIPAPTRLTNLPQPHSDVFVGREADMTRLHTAMTNGTGVITQVLRGLGGIGKSTLALHYAHQQRDAFNPVWWITADNPDTITNDLAALTARLNPYSETTGLTAPQAAAWALTWLQTHTDWLLILDNAQDPQTIAKILGPLSNGHHLITSRRANGWHHLAQPLELDTISPEAAITLLQRITGQTGNTAVLRELAAELGHLPLALEQAAAYIRQTALPTDRYLTRLRSQPARMFATPANGSDRDRTIARIWKITLDTVAGHAPLAGHLLRTLAWLAPDGLPRELLYGVDNDEIAVDEALGHLNDYSMITLSEETVTTHRLVQAVARTSDPADPHRTPDAIHTAHKQAADLLSAALPDDPSTNVAGWPRWRLLLPHIETFITLTRPQADTEEVAAILNESALYLSGQGQVARATTYNTRSLEAITRLHGEDHPDTLASRNNLAGAYESAGDLGRAIALYEQTLTDSTRILGKDHPDTLASRNNLAGAYESAGDLGRAIALYEQTLTDRTRILGKDHPSTLASRNNLAGAYESAGDLGRAIALYEQTLTDSTRILGKDHPSTLTSRNNLAYTYQSAGDLGRAIALYEQTLTDSTRILGKDHPDTLASRNNLAGAYESAGDLGRAIALYEQTLTDSTRILGKDHPSTLASRNNLAGAYESAGDLGRAIALYEQTLTDSTRILGKDHPSTLASRNNLAGAYESAGDLGRAIALYEQTLTDSTRILGKDHPSTLTSRNNLAYTYQSAGDLGRAIALYEQTLTDSTRILGKDHPSTLTSRNNLAYTYQSAGDLGRAIALYEQTLTDRTRILGKDHPSTLTSRNNLAGAYQSAGDLGRAIALYEQTLTDRTRILGKDHPSTLTSRNNLAYTYQSAGDLGRAIALYERALADCVRVLGGDHPLTRTVQNNLAASQTTDP